MEVTPKKLEAVVKNYVEPVNYSQGKFDASKSKNMTFTQQKFPESTKKPIERAPVITIDWKVLEDKYGNLEKVLAAEDRRKLISETKRQSLPYSAILLLEFQFPSKDYKEIGSGVLVGPRHLLTVAHNIYDHEKQEWSKTVQVHTPFGPGHILRAFMFNDCDLALLVLDDNFGALIGWLGMASYTNLDKLEKETIRVTGFPGERDKFRGMYSHKGEPKRHLDGLINYDVDTTYGQSGSPIWLKGMIENSVVGIHTSRGSNADEAGGEERFNIGVLLTHERLMTIIRWIEETYTVQA